MKGCIDQSSMKFVGKQQNLKKQEKQNKSYTEMQSNKRI